MMGCWHLVGEPDRDRLGLTVASDGAQQVWVDEPDNAVAACPAYG